MINPQYIKTSKLFYKPIFDSYKTLELQNLFNQLKNKNITYMDTESSIFYPNNTDETYLDNYKQFIIRARKIFDNRSPIRRAVPAQTLKQYPYHKFNSIRIRGTNAIFYYNIDVIYYQYDIVLLIIDDVIFPLLTDDASSYERNIFHANFPNKFTYDTNLSFEQLMGEIIDFYEDYADEFGIAYAK